MTDMTPYVAPVMPQGEQSAIRPGSWWEARAEEHDIPEGTAVNVSDVEVADGRIHTVHVAMPPALVKDGDVRRGLDGWGWKFLVPDFLAAFRPLREAEALARRQGEIDKLNNRTVEIQAGMAEAQSSLGNLAPAPALPSLAGPAQTDGRQVAVTTADLRRTLEDRAVAIRAASEAIQAGATEMRTVVQRIALYMSERASVALAAVKPTLAVAARLQEQVDTLGLYAGTDVEVTSMADGVGACASEKLFMMQRRIYLDEELLIHLDAAGADRSDTPTFSEMLKRDPALVERIFGAQRSVVAACWRRFEKKYTSGPPSMANAIIEATENRENRRTFLLVRNGAKVWKVDFPESAGLSGIQRLFPTPDDLEKPYKVSGWFREEADGRIGPDQIGYAKATEEFRLLAVTYERVLLCLCGLHDREQLFGEFRGMENYGGFGDPGFQRDFFRLVWDDERLLGENRPDYRSWIATQNKGLRPGSRVAVNWLHAMSADSAPGAVVESTGANRWDSRRQFRKSPVSPFSIAAVRLDGGDIVASCPVKFERYVDGDFRMEEGNVRVDLGRALVDDRTCLLVLDALDPGDVRFYLDNRASRKHYINYAGMLVAAKTSLETDAEHEFPARQQLVSAVRASGLMEPQGGWEAAVFRAVRDWRADNRGAPLPAISDPSWPKVRERLMGSLWFAVDGDGPLRERVLAHIAELGEKPLCLVRDTSNRPIVYTRRDPHRSDTDMIGDWPFLQRLVLKVARDGTVTGQSRTSIVPSQAMLSGQTILASFGEVGNHAQFADFKSEDKVIDLLDQVRRVCSLRCVASDPLPTVSAFEAVLRHVEETAGSLRIPFLSQPFGFGVSIESGRRVLHLIEYLEKPMSWLARHAVDPHTRALLEAMVGRTFRKPAVFLADQQLAGSPPAGGIGVVRLTEPPDTGVALPCGAVLATSAAERTWRSFGKGQDIAALSVEAALSWGRGAQPWVSPQGMAALQRLVSGPNQDQAVNTSRMNFP